MVIDALATRLSRGKLRFDRNGRMAGRGRVHEPLLKHWLRHSYFSRPPPKSCGREEFGASFVDAALGRYGRRLSAEDLIATATMLTAATIADAYRRFLPTRRERPPVDEMILCGGGAFNATSMSMLPGPQSNARTSVAAPPVGR